MGGQESKPLPEAVKMNIFIQSETNKENIEIFSTTNITDIKKIIHDKIDCKTNLIFCETTHVLTYFNKSYNTSTIFSIDNKDEISLNTVSDYGITEGDTIRYVIIDKKIPFQFRILSLAEELEQKKSLESRKKDDSSSTGLF